MHNQSVPALQIAAYQPQAEQLARRIAWLPEHVDDLVQIGLVAALKAADGIADADCPEAFAHVVMRRAMQDSYSKVDREDIEVQPPEESIPIYIAVTNTDAFGHLVVAEFFAAVRQELGSRAATIAQELYNPSQEVRRLVERQLVCDACHEFAEECSCEQPFVASGQVFLRPIVRKYLGIREDRWPMEIKALQDFAAVWFELSPTVSPQRST